MGKLTRMEIVRIEQELKYRVPEKVVQVSSVPSCPTCTNPVTLEHTYCPHCGQRLNWDCGFGRENHE